MHFVNAKFITSAVDSEGYPKLVDKQGRPLPEVAVAGRSNVGKSSLLNHLFQSKKLVKTSATPGKTQMINFFTVNDLLSFADLPGYGFAKVPVSVRKQWGPMVQKYLDGRESLKLLLFLFDIRRIPNNEDRELLDWASHREKSTILILTKVDKVNQSEKRRNTEKILQGLATGNLHYLHYSVLKNVGRKILINKILDALKCEEEGIDEEN